MSAKLFLKVEAPGTINSVIAKVFVCCDGKGYMLCLLDRINHCLNNAWWEL